MSNTRRPIAIDLFAGAGGLSLGFEQAGFDVAACVELDPVHCAAHAFNFPRCATICASVASVSGDEIRRRAGLGDATVDVVCGGAPCQGFSLIGKRALDDPRNSLVSHFLRLVTELDANYFVFENVKGLTLGQHRKFLTELISEFQARGYDVVEPFRVLNACHFGVPQSRQRLFLVGAKRGLTLPEYPHPTTFPGGTKNNGHSLAPVPTVWEAIGDLPEVEKFEALLDVDSVHAAFQKPSRYAARLRGLSQDETDYSYPRAYDKTLLTSSLRAVHTELSRTRFAEAEFGKAEPISRFHKLDPEGVCNTLRAGTASDHGAFTSPRPIHPFTPRCITVREAARLHSYPDWFRFHVTKWHGFRQIGNSVPPILARNVASQVVRAMGQTPKRPTKTINLGEERLLRLSMADAAQYYGVPFDTIAQRTRRIDTAKLNS